MLHLSPNRYLYPLITSAHKSVELLLRQGELLQFNGKEALGKNDAFHWEVLSDNFQSRPKEELMLLPPIQQPFEVFPQRISANLSSSDVANAAKCPP